MARHIFKLIVLLVPSLLTLGLLGFSLFSDYWIKIKDVQLEQVQTKYENGYNLFSGAIGRLAKPNETEAPVRVPIAVAAGTTTPRAPETTRTRPTTTTTTTTSSTTPSRAQADYTDGESLGDDIAYDNDEYRDKDPINPNDYELNAQDDFKNRKKLKRQAVPPPPPQPSVINFVYITKLWPLIKYKSLYSECIEYKKMHLKLSASYLNQINKAPIVGSINYGAYLKYVKAQLIEDARGENKQCDNKIGYIKCVLNQQCVPGKNCDGIVDCDDQSDEQFCTSNSTCRTQTGGFHCEQNCYQPWQRCDQMPNCFDLSDETDPSCTKKTLTLFSSVSSFNFNETLAIIQQKHVPFTLGQSHYSKKHNCFVSYFDFKSAQLIRKDNLKYLTQKLADQIQETNNINYHLQLICAMSFISAFVFCLLALLSLAFISCFGKLCFQCPFWFYGFFQILCWLSCLCGMMTFLYQWFINQQKSFDPYTRLPIDNELIRLNPDLLQLQDFGVSFWTALAATCVAFLGSFFSCLICCRLPTSRHEDKEYKIMQLPTYS